MIKAAILTLLLLGNGIATAVSVKNIQLELPPESTPAAETAQNELNHYLGLAIRDTMTVNGVPVATITLQIDPELAEEAWSIRTNGDRIEIAGGGSRGLLYGVYNFLENQIGIHWWTPQEETVPPPRDIALPQLALSGQPEFLYRDIWRTDEFPDEGRFYARNRLNRDGDSDISPSYGGSFAYGSPYHCHTFNVYFPKERYFADHPEYYSFRDGERRAGQYQGQLCLTNPEVRTLTVSKLREYIEADRKRAAEKNLPPPQLYDLSMNDNWNACRCPECSAEAERYGDSGILLNFLNSIAEEIQPDYPDIYITTLGYFFNEPTPLGGVTAHPRVIIKLCDTTSSQAVGILHPVNANFEKLVNRWKDASQNLFIWDYGINYLYPALPYPGEMTYAELHRFYRDHAVKGIFWQDDEAAVADFYPMKIWLTAKLLENPDADFEGLRRTFLDGYFGAAGREVGRYRELLASAASRNSARVDCMAGIDAYWYIDAETLMECHRIMDQAESEVADQPELRTRVIRARAGLDALTAQCFAHYNREWQEKNGSPLPIERARLAARLRTWGEDSKRYANPAHLQALAEQYANYAEIMPATYTPPKFFAGRRYRDFTAELLSVTADPGIRLVADPEAENGVAVRLDLQKNTDGLFGLPFEFGIYDTSKGRHVEKIEWEKAPEQRQYQWIPIGGFHSLTNHCFFYLSRSWRVQLRLNAPDDNTAPIQGWVRIRFSGKAFYPDSNDDSYIWIDRIVLLEQDDPMPPAESR